MATTKTVYYTVQYQGCIEIPSDQDPQEYLEDLTSQQLLSNSETDMSIEVDTVEDN